MAPPKATNLRRHQNNMGVLVRTGVTTRNKNALMNNTAAVKPLVPLANSRLKRKAEVLPDEDKNAKRSALGNITNAPGKSLAQLQDQNKTKKTAVAAKVALQTKTSTEIVLKKTEAKIIGKLTAQSLVKSTVTRSMVSSTLAKPTASSSALKHPVKHESTSNAKTKPVPRSKQTKEDGKKALVCTAKTKPSAELEKSEDSLLYVSALEDISNESATNLQTGDIHVAKISKESEVNVEPGQTEKPVERQVDYRPAAIKLPEGVLWDFDDENWLDPHQVSAYAADIFNYLKERERLFPIGDYMDKQVCLTKWMRSLLVDWMVEIQESFELNHETLYLAVKLVDLYLTKVTVGKETLQLLGAASLFIASKFDERIPPMVEDFLYICDGAYSQRELIRMEINILKVIDFDLGIPLSYRFLRRYGRCAKVSMPTLTLARYILEHSLMDYGIIRYSDSKMAAAALLLALEMKDLGGWTPTLEFYTGYKLSDIKDIVNVLNAGLHQKHKEALATIRNKYSHKIFFEVAKVPLKEVIDF